jgi:hypothetical protein
MSELERGRRNTARNTHQIAGRSARESIPHNELEAPKVATVLRVNKIRTQTIQKTGIFNEELTVVSPAGDVQPQIGETSSLPGEQGSPFGVISFLDLLSCLPVCQRVLDTGGDPQAFLTRRTRQAYFSDARGKTILLP